MKNNANQSIEKKTWPTAHSEPSINQPFVSEACCSRTREQLSVHTIRMKRSWRVEPGSPFAHDDRNSRDSLGSPDQLEERAVGYFIGFGILYIVLMITLGVL